MKGPRQEHYQQIVVGGGFFGALMALHLAEACSGREQRPGSVLLIEREAELMTRASLANQARVHGGYHYPRSLVTGLRSRVNYELFCQRFSAAVVRNFKSYYAISARFSNVTAQQFRTFCQRIDAPLRPAPAVLRRLTTDLIQDLFEVEECAFDATILRHEVRAALERAGVEVLCGWSAERLSSSATKSAPLPGISIDVRAASDSAISGTGNAGPGFADPSAPVTLHAAEVFLCTYSAMNRLLARSALPLIPLRHEYTEIALIEAPAELSDMAFTVMCGPFFSCMPYPVRGLHSLSHVRYTPHFSWDDGGEQAATDAELASAKRRASHFLHMRKDAERYLPCMHSARQVDSLWETKTVMPRNALDDARPILFKRNHGLLGLTCLLGAKIDNVFDVLKEYERERQP